MKCTAYGLSYPTHLHAWHNAFCPHPDTGVLSQGIGFPHGALPVNWSGPVSSLVHHHWKPQMRRSTNAFIFIRKAQEKVSGSFCAAEKGTRKALKPDDCLPLFVVLQVRSLSHNVCAVSMMKLYCRPSHPYLITWCFCAVFVGFFCNEMFQPCRLLQCYNLHLLYLFSMLNIFQLWNPDTLNFLASQILLFCCIPFINHHCTRILTDHGENTVNLLRRWLVLKLEIFVCCVPVNTKEWNSLQMHNPGFILVSVIY